MPKLPKTQPNTKKRLPPATTPEGREKQIISLAYDLVEERLRNGTASASETVAILRLGTQRERLEREKIAEEVKLTRTKSEAIAQAKEIKEMMSEAISAFKRYSGSEEEEMDEDLL